MDYYLDTEFNGFGGDLISLALVREDGRGLYTLYAQEPPYTDWVKQNVLPYLYDFPAGVYPIEAKRSTGSSIGARERCPTTASCLQEFFKGDPSPHVISDWPDDIKYLCQELITGPGRMIEVPHITFEVLRVDAWPFIPEARQHNAYWDALALKAKAEEIKQKE